MNLKNDCEDFWKMSKSFENALLSLFSMNEREGSVNGIGMGTEKVRTFLQ